MPSEVWKYFDEFKGGAKCKLCGTIRNRKDKSTSTFWQHLKKIHQISQLKTPYSKTEEEFIEVKDQNIMNLIKNSANENVKLKISAAVASSINILSPIKPLSENSVNGDIGKSIKILQHLNIPNEYIKVAGNIFSMYNQMQLNTINAPSTSFYRSSSVAMMGAEQNIVWGQKKREDFIKWDEFFMGTALLAAQRSKDPSTQVGAVLVNEQNVIIGIGYNGMPVGCSDDDFPWGKTSENQLESKYTYVCHAEMNAILNKNSESAKNTTIYCSMFPCNECAKMIIQCRIKKVVYLHDKPNKNAMIAAKKLFTATKIPFIQYVPSQQQIVLDFSSSLSSKNIPS